MSQICNLICFPSIVIILAPNSTPEKSREKQIIRSSIFCIFKNLQDSIFPALIPISTHLAPCLTIYRRHFGDRIQWASLTVTDCSPINRSHSMGHYFIIMEDLIRDQNTMIWMKVLWGDGQSQVTPMVSESQ